MKNESGLVSVIIPAYQSAHLIERAINSCFLQTYLKIEVIVVNDGSTDNLENICSKYRGLPRFKFINKANGGLSSARNAGLKEAQGEFVQFLDADDYLLPEKILTQVNFLTKSPEYVGAYCNYFFEKNSKVMHTKKKYKSGNLISEITSPLFILPIHALLLRRSSSFHFDESLHQIEDRDFLTRLFLESSTKIKYINKIHVAYVLHENNMSNKKIENLITHLSYLKKYRNFLECGIYRRSRGLALGLLGLELVCLRPKLSRLILLITIFQVSSFYKFVFFIYYLLSFNQKIYVVFRKIISILRNVRGNWQDFKMYSVL